MGPDVTGMAPWLIVAGEAPQAAAASQARVSELRKAGFAVDRDAVIAPHAVVGAEQFMIGPRSYLADYTHIRDDVRIGADCSVNAFTEIRGRVRIGDGVRIGASTSILGFNHEMERVDVPIHQQGITSRGISIGDDVWLGAHVVVLDGVRIGSHSVVGAGAVVTRDVPEYAVAVGNPARVVRDRRDPRDRSDPRDRCDPRPEEGLQEHPADAAETPRDGCKNTPRTVQERPAEEAAGEAAAGEAAGNAAAGDAAAEPAEELAGAIGGRLRRDLPAILATAFDGERFRDAPGAAPTPRAHCDAIELADLVGEAPPQLPRPSHLDLLRADLAAIPTTRPTPTSWPSGAEAYHVLCVGYALDLLGEPPGDDFPAWTSLPLAMLPKALGSLPWDDHAWGAGAEVDTLGTAWTWAGQHSHRPRRDTLIGWLLIHRDPLSGLWGSQTSHDGWRQAVNGTYRLVRGTFAQWGRSAGEGVAVVDSVLAHARSGILEFDRVTACDALDVAYLLWWARREGGEGHREREVTELAHQILALAAQVWHDGEGAPFAPSGTEQHLASGADPTTPSLQGTEMWLALAWYAADILGSSAHLGYRPRGIHRPEPRST